MKIRIVGMLVGLLCWNVLAQTANQDVTDGLNFLSTQDLVDANTQFTNALALSPANEDANALVAATRLLLLPTQPVGSNFLNSIGFSRSGRDVFDWTATLPVDINGNTVFPSNSSSVMIAFYRTNIMAALEASGTNLASITDTGFSLSLTASETSEQTVTVDYGDLLLLQALLRTAEFAGYTLNAQNFDVVLSQLQTIRATNGLTIQRVLSLYPSLLTQSSASDLEASKGALTNAIALYLAASDFIRNVRAPGTQGLFNLSPDETNNEALFRTELTNALLSLNGPVQFDPALAFSIEASNYFSGTKTLRSLLPQFNGDVYVNDTLPDYTFGGILVNEPAYQTEALLRRNFHSYAGIYVGDGGLSDSSGYNGSSFAVFIGTNQQATLIGYDNGDDSNDGTDFPVFEQFTLNMSINSHGDWSFTSNNISGFGNIDKNGDFTGEVDGLTDDNGDTVSVYLNGNEQSSFGPFQNAAGYYGGTFSSSGSSPYNKGTLFAVVASDGELFFQPFDSVGTPSGGGSAQLGSNGYFTTTQLDGTVVTGALTNATLKIGGNIKGESGTSGTFIMSRSANVPFDVPPVITTKLPLTLTVPLGTNVTFSLTATGSQPVGYQWYSNNVIIPAATTDSLTINDVQYGSAGTYSVTISNIVGGINADVTLIVVPETVPPTNTITSPTSGQRWSNAVFNVTGTAKDNVGVTNVFYSLNNTGWSNAMSANNWTNWTAVVTLTPGTNTLQAYAVDSSGNVSTTNSVKFVYILSAVLTVETNGEGSISPAYNGVLLQISNTYSMTATAKAGFGFVNWTDGGGDVLTNGATLKFVVASNLTFIANFVDTARPTNTITSPTANQRWSNAVFNVTGTARDNVGVTNVFYSLNNTGWSNAMSANNWTNWTAAVTLTPGTNILQAYAVDSSGNVSTTNSVKFVYILSAVLTVETNGEGSISPAYNGVLLQIGVNYSMTATAKTGFGFVNWTDGLGNILTNKATLKFQMASNLTFVANFVDTARPTNTITSPTANQRWSNDVFNVIGTAKDNVGVTNVFYSLNNTGWSNAMSANNWTNWTAQVTLTPGTNTLQAYAVDSSGNVSTTNSVKFVYILSAVLTVETNGEGSISPAYNGVLLQISNTYSMTATAKAGFGFVNWTDGLGNILTNKATLKFQMASNLTFIANFVDTARPTNTITSPTANQRWSNAVFNVTGTARDNVGVANVFYSLDGSDWTTATLSNNGSNWTAQVTLIPGANIVQAYAVDAAGNISTTNTVKFVYVTVDWAPGSLNGLVAAVAPVGLGTFYDGFWTNTFSQSSADTNNYNAVGDYTYTKLSTNTAQLVMNYTSPPAITGESVPVFLTFISNNLCTFSNVTDSADIGTVVFSASANLVPSSFNGVRAIVIDSAGKQTDVSYGSSSITITNSNGQVETGTYNARQYSPVGAMIVIKGSSMTNYLELTFATTNYGDFFITTFDNSEDPTNTDEGVFVRLSQSAGGNAPASLAGTNGLVTQQGSPFLLSLDTTTFTQTSADTNYNGVGDYTYTKLGENTAQLTISYTNPPTLTNEGGSVFLTFVAPDFGLFTNQDDLGSNYIATISLSVATNLVPASLAGLTVSATNNDGTIVDVVTYNNDGTFTQTETGGDNPGVSTGTYTFTTYSPVGGMVQLNFTGGVVTGSTAYIQTTFTAGGQGTFFSTFYDAFSDPPTTSSGTFSVQ